MVHPEIARQAVLAARVVGLDIAGLDILATDIREPLEGQRGAVVEVNAGPSLTPHVSPLFGKPRPVGDAIIQMLYPPGGPSRVLIVVVLASATSGTRHRAERIASQYSQDGLVVGCVDGAAIRVEDRHIGLTHCSIAERVQAVLGHPHVDVLLVELDPRQLGCQSSPVPRIDRLVVDPSVVDDVDRLECQDAWKTIVHSMTPDTMVDWTETADQDRKNLAARWNRLGSDFS
jgi:cyanophycin synthetase